MAEMTAQEAVFVLKKSTILSSTIKSNIVKLLEKHAAREIEIQDIIKNADSFAYCPNCQVKVAPCRITFEELHDSCGHSVLWIEDAAPIVAMQKLIERQQAEIAKKDRMIEIACEMLKAAYETCNNCPIENFCDGVENREIICPGIWAMWLEKEAEVQG